MEATTLSKLDKDIQEIKAVLHRVMHVLEEDFELNDAVKEELATARAEPLSEYIDHKEVLKEFR
ncbi:hypothetical protein HYT52_00135 [Candidatus Woesearchaeota archaeon]|nr:hypothetical protein [Candidatus Woesearchaeota archaeon]